MRVTTSPMAPRWAARLLLALCLVASSVQGFVAQTHVHAGPALYVAGLATLGTVAADELPTPEPRCLLCDIAGHSPAIAPPAAAATVAAVELVSTIATGSSRAPAAGNSSHHWLGRGPPNV
jgi:hypothetical protein